MLTAAAARQFKLLVPAEAADFIGAEYSESLKRELDLTLELQNLQVFSISNNSVAAKLVGIMMTSSLFE